MQAVPTALIATASINFGFWFFALPFGYCATLQVVRKFNQLDREKLDVSIDRVTAGSQAIN